MTPETALSFSNFHIIPAGRCLTLKDLQGARPTYTHQWKWVSDSHPSNPTPEIVSPCSCCPRKSSSE
ncbi:hypothetical protein AVEN_146690-1, partial [Araneus ventricosus]